MNINWNKMIGIYVMFEKLTISWYKGTCQGLWVHILKINKFRFL